MAAVAITSTACSEPTPTQVVVQLYVETELATSATRLHVAIENDEGKLVLDRDKALTGSAGRIARIPLLPKNDDPTRRFIVRAALYDGADVELARLEARAGYTPDELRSLNLSFANACRGKICDSGRTCQRGICRGACFATGPAEASAPNEPICGECEQCVVGCEPTDGAACGCPGESCVGTECVPNQRVSFVGAGFVHTCAALLSGDVYCWGSGGPFGRLGLGANVDSPKPALVPNVVGSEGIAVSGNYTCALSPESRVCWGENDVGQLGSGTTSGDVLVPTAIDNSALMLTTIRTGWQHMCGSEQDRIWCWGLNNYGQVGIGTTSDAEPTPALVGSGYTSLTLGAEHSCALRTDGALKCWGQNKSLQVGVASGQAVTKPAQPGCPGSKCFADWVRVAAGYWHTCALRESGKMYCWGSNRDGQLGIGPQFSTDDLLEPQAVDSSIAFSEAAGGSHYACGLDRDAALWCWGKNDQRELAIPDLDLVASPTRVDVDAPNGWKLMSLGDTHMCAIRQDGTLWCWGNNADGQIGSGATSSLPAAPTRVCF